MILMLIGRMVEGAKTGETWENVRVGLFRCWVWASPVSFRTTGSESQLNVTEDITVLLLLAGRRGDSRPPRCGRPIYLVSIVRAGVHHE
jgi:hypothetical protein